MITIPFNKPHIIGKELFYISQCIINGHASGDGPKTIASQQYIECAFNAKKVLLTHSCTAALEMAAILIGVQPGDEIIMPSYTFVSTANAFCLHGAKPVFVDIRPDTLNIDEQKIEAAITNNTKAIVVVHYGGVACEMDAIMALARKHGLYVIEDAAQAVNATYQGERYLGTIGDIGCYSFHETKNISCGEGGAIVLNNAALIERAEIIREKGTNRKKYFRGEVDKYTWVDIGSSFLPSDMLAAYLYAQLENMDVISQKRKQLFKTYYELLLPLERSGFLHLPQMKYFEHSNGHLFYVLSAAADERDELLAHLKSKGVYAVFHYVPLHSSEFGRRYGERSLPITEDLSARLIRLPMFYELTLEQQVQVAQAITDYYVKRSVHEEVAALMMNHIGQVVAASATAKA